MDGSKLPAGHSGQYGADCLPGCGSVGFPVLAALYESWTLPLAVILIVPMTMLSALFGVWLTGGDNNVFVQVGLVVLMGLACKTLF